MKQFKIKSPSGKLLIITADGIYHACEKANQLESYKFGNVEYLKLNKKMNILEKANEIVNLRFEEKERQYGPFEEGMERASKILSGMTGVDVNTDFMYKAMIALKLSRESYNHKEDNLLDAVAYIGSYNNYKNKK